MGRRARPELVLDGRRSDAVAGPGHHQVARRRRIDVEIAINLIFAIGIAAGSLGAAALAHGHIQLAPAPFLLLIMAALAIDIGLSIAGDGAGEPGNPADLVLRGPGGPAHGARCFVYSAAAGLFVVPIFAAVQAWAGEDRRARVVAAVNALNYIAMVLGSLATMMLLQVAA